MFTLPELTYGYDALEPFIDKETMMIHHDKHHAAYVKNLNDSLVDHGDLLEKDIKVLISNLDSVPEEIRTKVRNNGGGHFNHSFFWDLMTPGGEVTPGPKLSSAIDADFGSFSAFQEKFLATSLARFGSGWVWLSVSDKKLAIIDTPNQDTPIMEGKEIILGLDVWEHAYYLKYKNMRADYVSNWWNVVNWAKVEEKYSEIIGGESK